MNELIGTITLAYVEEDNRQRMIFRIVPLMTKEGYQFHGNAEEFPDEGSLRIVPDKREQGTFKDRMRSLAGFCAVALPKDGKEKMKIRQNRNYNPENGEKNQNALYSDVVCEFAEDGCFEVMEAGSDCSAALTSKVLLRKAMMLYGPVASAEAKTANISALKPFGNDSYLLQTIDTAATGKRQVYWNPEMILSWRQRKQAGKKKAEGEAPANEAAAPRKKPEVSPKNGVKTEAPKADHPKAEGAKAEAPKAIKVPRNQAGEQPAKPAPKEARPVPTETAKTSQDKKAASPKPVQPKKPEAKTPETAKPRKPVQEKKPTEPAKPHDESDTALPIGESLDILDSEISFDQQLSRLAQPLSETANRLTEIVPEKEAAAEETADEELLEANFHSNATELTPSAEPDAGVHTPTNVFCVVERALRGQRDKSTAGYITNPITCLRDCVDAIWQDDELREQALTMLLGNGEFADDILAAFRKKGVNLRLKAVAEEQLSAITAERIELLMALRLAKENEKKYQQETLAKLNQRSRDESERLKRELERLRTEKNRLLTAEKALSTQNRQLICDFVAQNADALGGMTGNVAVLSPVVGQHYDSEILTENLRVNLNDSGFSISEDDAQALLVCFSLFDKICLKADCSADAFRFSEVLLDSFGLRSVSAVLHRDSNVQLINLLKDGSNRTPTVSIQPLGTDCLCAVGHKVIYIATGEADEDERFSGLLSYPVIAVPPLARGAYSYQANAAALPEPASLSSFAAISSESKKLLSEAEKWFSDLQDALRGCKLPVSEALYTSMRRFVAVSSGILRGGFPVAADTALCLWIAPLLLRNRLGTEALSGVADGLSKITSLLQGVNHD